MAGGGDFKMIDVGDKPVTFRRAVARGEIRLGPEAYRAIKERRVPKGDVLALAQVAGIMAAKRTPDLLPLCHPLLLEKVGVRAELGEGVVTVTSEVSGHGKTGFEMEALVAASAALLCVYDLTKMIDPHMEIGGVRLVEKEGGKSGHWTAARTAKPSEKSNLRVGVLVVSDRVSRGEAQDSAGAAIAAHFGAAAPTVVPDEMEKIATAVRALAQSHDLVITTGGTGFGPRDVTPEALATVCDRMIPGLGEKLRRDGAAHTPMSWLSRQTAGLVGRALVVALPGSKKAAVEGIESLEALLPHALQIAQGGNHG